MTPRRPDFNICVFCGASPGARPEYMTSAYAVGAALAQAGIGMVYGGASIGLMGAVANGCLEAGGYVEGVIPEALFFKEVAHARLSRRSVVPSMHARKALMAQQANGFLVLPGGFGTLEELFEITTWAQLGIHAKPIVLFNIANFFDTLLQLADHMVREGFITPAQRSFLVVRDDIASAISDLRSYTPPVSIGAWIDRDQT